MGTTALHDAPLWQALNDIARQVQSARTTDEALRRVGEGLERLGYDVVLAESDLARFRLRFVTQPKHGALLRAVGLQVDVWHAKHRPWPTDATNEAVWGPLELMVSGFSDDVSAALCTELRSRGLQTGVLAPISTRSGAWGVLCLLHADLEPRDVGPLALFALQLGASLELVEAFERLERRTNELDLVYQLASAATAEDVDELSARALATVARSTQSDAAVLHRFDPSTALYELVGTGFGYEGPLLEQFRTFPKPELLATTPLVVPVSELAYADDITAAGFAHMALVPLVVSARDVGLLTLARTHNHAYSAETIRTGELLGVQLASMLERARLYVDLKRSYDELARTQAELVKHERLAALGELAAVMAHEVRNPLGVIFNSLATLRRLHPQTGDADMLLTMVGEEADRLNRIVSDLLDFARPYEVSKTPIAIEPVITGAVDAARSTLTSSNVVVSTELVGVMPRFAVDGQLVRQALVNLIVNAMQAMPKQGTVTVRSRHEQRGNVAWLIVEVRDEGSGLPPQISERMFQPFFTTKATGTGLGLAVVKRIVDAHQGEISARANAPAVGTTFVMKLPSVVEAEA